MVWQMKVVDIESMKTIDSESMPAKYSAREDDFKSSAPRRKAKVEKVRSKEEFKGDQVR